MKHDIFEFTAPDLTFGERLSRVLFLVTLIAAIALDLFLWRPL